MKNERTHIFCSYCDLQGYDEPWHSEEDFIVEYDARGRELLKYCYEKQNSLDTFSYEESEGDDADLYEMW